MTMSTESSRQDADERPPSTPAVSGSAYVAQPASDQHDGDTAAQPQPTFTPTVDNSGQATGGSSALSVPPAVPPAPVPPATLPADEPLAARPVDEPLLANAAGMRASWQTVQAEFVDDPRAAVSDAADLIDHTVEALVDALQQRQRQLRMMSDTGNGAGARVSDTAEPGSVVAGEFPDTEQLRLIMQRYRALFNQICHV